MVEKKTIAFKGPRSTFTRLRINFALAHFTWRWLWTHREENVTILFKVDEDQAVTS
jgi:hypothetical protein